MKHRSAQRPLLYLLVWIGDCGLSLFIFTVTRHLAEQDGNFISLGIFGSCLSLTVALCAALFGHFADRLDRRRMIAAGSLLMGVSFGIGLWSLEVPWIYLQAVLMGLASALIIPPVIALLSAGSDGDVNRPRPTRTLIFFCLSWNLGMVSGQFFGGFLFVLGATVSIKVCLVLAVCHFALNLFSSVREKNGLPSLDQGNEATPSTEPQHPMHEVPVTRRKMFAIFGWIANIAGSSSMGLIIFVLPQLMTTLEISAPIHGSMLMSSRFLVIATYFGLHFSRFWHFRLLPGLCAQTVAMVGLLIITVAGDVPLLTLGVVLIGVMMGYNYFSGIFYAITGFGNRRGFASGMHEGTLAMGFLIGSLGGGFIGSIYGVRAPFAVGMGMIGLAMALETLGYIWFGRLRARDKHASA